jgi:E3 ubiquitin-protein ligase UBR4
MVGCRLHVGNTSASHIPSELRVFHRSVRLEEGVRSWYDIPFTNAEALLADEEVTLTIGPTFNGSSLPRVDCLEIYGRSKDDFGWKEKLDAVLALESPAQGSSISSVSSTSKTKRKLMPDSTAPERILSDSLHLLFNYYLVSRAQSTSDSMEIKLEESKKRCLPVLEIVFESDRQLLLQSSARRVLRALYPVKDAYNQVDNPFFPIGIINVTACGVICHFVYCFPHVERCCAEFR